MLFIIVDHHEEVVYCRLHIMFSGENVP